MDRSDSVKQSPDCGFDCDEIASGKVVIRSYYYANDSQNFEEENYVSWQSRLYVGDRLIEGRASSGEIKGFFQRFFASLVGSSSFMASLNIQVDDNKPFTLMSSNTDASDYSDGYPVSPYILVRGSTQSMKLTVSASALDQYQTELPGNIVKMGQLTLPFLSLPAGVAKVAIDSALATDTAAAKANQSVSNWINSTGAQDKCVKYYMNSEFVRLKKIQILLYDRPVNDSDKKHIATIELFPNAVRSIFTRAMQDSGIPDFSMLSNNILLNNLNPKSADSLKSLLSETTRTLMHSRDASAVPVICSDAKTVFEKYGFNRFDVSALVLASLKSSAGYKRYFVSGRNECPSGFDYEEFARLKLPYAAFSTHDSEERRAQQQTALEMLSDSTLTRGVPIPEIFSDKFVLYQQSDALPQDLLGDRYRVGVDMVFDNGSAAAIFSRVTSLCGAAKLGDMALSSTSNSARALFSICERRFFTRIEFEDEVSTYNGAPIRKIRKIAIGNQE